ncbi:MAG: hypothetical protein ACK4MU_06955 [Thermomonas sp.]
MNTVLPSVALAATLLFASSAFAMAQAGATAAKPAAAPAKGTQGDVHPANRCRDGKGKFIKCEAAKPAKQACRDDTGKFTKCPAAPAAAAAKK